MPNPQIILAALHFWGKDTFTKLSFCLLNNFNLQPQSFPHGCRSSRKPLRCPRPREVRAFFSCLAWRAITSPLSKVKRRLDSLEATQGAPRYPRRDSGGERSPLLPLEARPDSPGEHGMQPRDPCLPWRGALGPGHTPRWGLFGPAVTRAQPPAFPLTRGEDWASQGQPKRKPEIPVVTRESRRNSRMDGGAWQVTVHGVAKSYLTEWLSVSQWEQRGPNW